MGKSPFDGFYEDETGRDPKEILRDFRSRRCGSFYLELCPPTATLNTDRENVVFDWPFPKTIEVKQSRAARIHRARSKWCPPSQQSFSPGYTTPMGLLLKGGWDFRVGDSWNDGLNDLVRLSGYKKPSGAKRVPAFVKKHGPLWVDKEGRYSPPPFLREDTQEWHSIIEMRGSEPIAQYMRWSRIAAFFMAIAFHHNQGEAAPLQKMEGLFEAYYEKELLVGVFTEIVRKGIFGPVRDLTAPTPFQWLIPPRMKEAVPEHPLIHLENQKEALFSLIREELERAAIAPTLSIGRFADGTPTFNLFPGLGVLGGVLFDLAAVLCGGKVIACCPSCGVVYMRKRRPKHGQMQYCPSCWQRRKEIKKSRLDKNEQQ